VEDRCSAGLYLEMAKTDPDVYAEARVDAVRALSGVEGATWWRNLMPGRTEFPRRIEEFATLGVYEVGSGFEAPPPVDGVRGEHFVRTPRPAQGRLTGKPTLGLELVLVSPTSPDTAQAFRDWADFLHIAEIAAASVPGFTMITPYENVGSGGPRYLHFYEMDTSDAEQAFQQMAPYTQARIGETPLWKKWVGHEALVIEYVNTFVRVGAR
jgi:hypothetical protein